MEEPREPMHCFKCGSVEHRVAFFSQAYPQFHNQGTIQNGRAEDPQLRAGGLYASFNGFDNAQLGDIRHTSDVSEHVSPSYQPRTRILDHTGQELQGGGFTGQETQYEGLTRGLAGQQLPPQDGAGNSHRQPQAQSGYEELSFLYPRGPPLASFRDFSTAASLVEEMYQWGQRTGTWAQGFRDHHVRLREVIKLQCDPSFSITETDYKCVITIPKTDQARLDLDNALYRAQRAIEGGIPPIYGFSATGSPILPVLAIPAVQFCSQPSLVTPDATPFGSASTATGNYRWEDMDGMGSRVSMDNSPTPRGRGGRGRGARGRGVS
jgi:hypothetical protein